MSLDARFAEAMGQLLGPDFPSDIALAVSGGGDSMAMLYLAHNWTRSWGLRLWVVTVHHGLRPEAEAEAQLVAAECRALGWPHRTLRWRWDGRGNVMDAARRARLALIDGWRGDIRHVLFAHTCDDVAETFLMRLRRGSGPDGLAAMAPAWRVPAALLDPPVTPLDPADWEDRGAPGPPRVGPGRPPFEVIRPCLEMRRADLRHYLRTQQGPWVEDATNVDPAFDRARMRELLQRLGEAGLGVETMAATARRMDRARTALRARAAQVWDEIGAQDALPPREPGEAAVPNGQLLFDADGFARVERDTQMRLLAAALQAVAHRDYRPRAEPLEALLDRLLGGGGGTLHGCEARVEGRGLRVFREYAAVRDLRVPLTAQGLWDRSWQACPQAFPDARADLEIRALGDAGWQQALERSDGAPPYHAARSLPGVWQDEVLLACDALGFGPGDTLRFLPPDPDRRDFRRFLLSR